MYPPLLVLFLSLLVFTNLHAHPPWGIVVDKHHDIYFADIGHHGRGAVWQLTKDGKLKLLLRDFHAHNVNLDQDGNVVTAHGEGHHTMVRRHPDGQLDTLYHTTDHHEFFGGNCTYAPDGKILFGIDHYIWEIDEHGQKRKTSKHYFEWNQGVYVDPEGIIYAPDIGMDNGVVVKIEPDGNATTIAKDLISQLSRPKDKHNDILLGITKDSDGFIYICELAGKRIIKILDDGATETYYHSEEEWFPTAVDFFAGDAYILEYRYTPNGMAGPQVVKVDEMGTKTVLFNYEAYYKTDFTPPPPHQERKDISFWCMPLLLGGIVAVVLLFLGWVGLRKGKADYKLREF